MSPLWSWYYYWESCSRNASPIKLKYIYWILCIIIDMYKLLAIYSMIKIFVYVLTGPY